MPERCLQRPSDGRSDAGHPAARSGDWRLAAGSGEAENQRQPTHRSAVLQRATKTLAIK